MPRWRGRRPGGCSCYSCIGEAYIHRGELPESSGSLKKRVWSGTGVAVYVVLRVRILHCSVGCDRADDEAWGPLAAPIPPFPQTIGGVRCDCQVSAPPRGVVRGLPASRLNRMVFDTGPCCCGLLLGVEEGWGKQGEGKEVGQIRRE
jgi:hypothetical protein